MLRHAGREGIEMTLTETVRAQTRQAVAELPAVLAQDVRLPGFLEGLLLMLDHWR